MKLCKRLLLSLLLAAFVLPATAYAAGSIDKDRAVSLTVSYRDGKTPLVGTEFSIYQVAAADEYGELTVMNNFKQFNVDIGDKNSADFKTLASTLEGYVLRDNITPTDSGKTGEDGYLTFPTDGRKLPQGLYLVLGKRHIQGDYYYDATPFMIMLPTQDTVKNEWICDLTVSPKHDSVEIPDTPTTVDRKVLKVWNDAGHESLRPKEIVVQLLRDGKVYDTVKLSRDNNWRCAWRGLDSSYTWTVVEKENRGYTVQVEREGITFVITNTYAPGALGPTEPTEPTVPTPTPTVPTNPTKPGLIQTGQLWWPVPVLLISGLLLVVLGLLCRRRFDDEP